MTVKELKELLNQFEEDTIIQVKDDCGDYDEAQDCCEDVERYWDSYSDYCIGKAEKIRKVVKIF